MQPEPQSGNTISNNLAPAFTLLATVCGNGGLDLLRGSTRPKVAQVQSGCSTYFCLPICFQAFFNYNPYHHPMPGFGKHFIFPSATLHRVKVFSANPSFTAGCRQRICTNIHTEKRGKAAVAKKAKMEQFLENRAQTYT